MDAMASRTQEFVAKLAAERREQLDIPAPQAPAAAPVAVQAPVAAPTQAPDAVAMALAKFEAQQKAAGEAQARAEAQIKAAEDRAAAVAQQEAELKASLENPLDFIARQGMSEDEWKAFLTNGATWSPEQKKIRELEKQNRDIMARFESMEKARVQAEAQARASAEAAALPMKDFPLLSRMGGVQHAQQVRERMQQQTGAQITLAQAAQHLENDFRTNLARLLKDSDVAGILGINQPKQSVAPAASSPTLGRNQAPSSAVNKPNPRDWEAKKRAYLEILRQQGNS